MKIVDIPIMDLRHRAFPVKSNDDVKRALLRFGQINPAAVIPVIGDWGYWIVDGHHRIKAARDLGWQSYRCVVLDPNDAFRYEVLANISTTLAD